jgi:hypothetical protein
VRGHLRARSETEQSVKYDELMYHTLFLQSESSALKVSSEFISVEEVFNFSSSTLETKFHVANFERKKFAALHLDFLSCAIHRHTQRQLLSNFVKCVDL